MASETSKIKIGNEEVSKDVFETIIEIGITLFKKELVDQVVKKDYQCFSCKAKLSFYLKTLEL